LAGTMSQGSGEAGAPPRLALTMGDARGIGPEVLLKALVDPRAAGRFEPVIIGVAEVLKAVAASLWPEAAEVPEPVNKALCSVVEVLGPGDNFPQKISRDELRRFLLENPRLCGLWAGRSIGKAVEFVSSGRADAVVTAPIDKSALNLAGYRYPGHTEMLSALAGNVEVAMMLVGDRLRVVPATTHVALARVTELVTADLLLGKIRITHRALGELFGIGSPRITLCGINPHLGDGGLFGDEDQRITAVAVRAAQDEGLGASGPYPADTVFVRAARGEFDAVIAAYHDQAMIAIKMHAFGRGVNITLGLPFIRTSPDHGTALDIAGQLCADASSMVEAVSLAASLSLNKRIRGTE